MSDHEALQSHFYLTIDGVEAGADLMRDMERVSVESSLHLPDVAVLVLHDAHLRWVDDAQLAPGVALKIASRARSDEAPLFDGEIVELEPDFVPDNHRLVVRAFDRLHRLGRGRHVRSFTNVTDGDLVRRIASELGLDARVGPTGQVYRYVLQANESNLQFLQRRAARLGYWLFVEGTTLHFVPPEAHRETIEVTWGDDLHEFRPRLTTIGQVASVVARGWDPVEKRPVLGEAAPGAVAPQIGQRRSGGELSARAFQLDGTQVLVADRPLRAQPEADAAAKAVADRIGARFVEADGLCVGRPKLTAGVLLTISSVGERFSGTYVVTGATHRASRGESYQTSFSVSGLTPSTLLGLLAPEQETSPNGGLAIGVVSDNNDPEGLGRVRLLFPWLSPDHPSDWARVASAGGGAQRGVEFLPEVGDEVLVGFEMGDLHHPYVVGGLWNGRDAPPEPSSSAVSAGRVERRTIRSRSGHTIVLDDTAGRESITIADRTGENRIVLNAADNRVELISQGDISIAAAGTVTISGARGVDVATDAQLTLDGQVGATLSSASRATVKAGMVSVEGNGPVAVRGTPIKLN